MEKLVCKRCGHKWFKRQEKLPKKCPHCTSVIWWKPKENKNAKDLPRRDR